MLGKSCKKCNYYDSTTVGHPDNRVFYCWKLKNYKAKMKAKTIARHCKFYSAWSGKFDNI